MRPHAWKSTLATTLFAAVTLACPAVPVRAQGPSAEPDTTLHGFLRALADSTDDYFGSTVAPLDTTGLDSTLAHRLAYPESGPPARRLRLEPGPWLRFNRVDGPIYGARLGLGSVATIGRWTGRLGYAAGPNDWLGGGEMRRRFGPLARPLFVTVRGGYLTEAMNRDHAPGGLNLARALLTGKDYTHYLRRQGYAVRLEHESSLWRAGVAWRDQKEVPIATSATWTLTGADPAVLSNLPAAAGRVHELEYMLGFRWPVLRGWTEVEHATSGDALGSDFEYRRTHATTAFEVPLGRSVSLVPQAEYGRLSGQVTSQAAFYLGGWHSLRNLHRDEKGGTGLALARLDVIWTADLLDVARIPHPDAFPIQAGAFTGVGAVWGEDPYGGPTIAGVDWPEDREWYPEAGLSLLYRPGLPEPNAYLRLSYAVALGSREHDGRWSIQYTRALDLVRPFGE